MLRHKNISTHCILNTFQQIIGKRRSWNKVFEVGAPKTGTTSLGIAYEILGLQHKGWDKGLYEECKSGAYDSTLKTAKKYDAFEDGPWHDFNLFKIFDTTFPQSKFILLERDEESWIESHFHHFSIEHHSKDVIDPIENYEEKKAEILSNFRKKYKYVKEYFKDRPSDLLVMNIIKGDGWEKLCPFLELPIPSVPFPHYNKTLK